MSTKSCKTGLPYILDIVPHLCYPQVTARNALRTMISRWPYYIKPSVIADSAIGSIELLEELTELGVTGTFSISSNCKPWLWEIMSNGLHEGSWRAIMLKGIMVSVLNSQSTESAPQKDSPDLNIPFNDSETEQSKSVEEEISDDVPNQSFSLNQLKSKKVSELRELC